MADNFYDITLKVITEILSLNVLKNRFKLLKIMVQKKECVHQFCYFRIPGNTSIASYLTLFIIVVLVVV